MVGKYYTLRRFHQCIDVVFNRFGRVELVQYKKKKNLVFSLKYLKKIEVVHMQQEKHVYNEKVIQMNCKSPFIVRLYRTYKDNK